MTGATSTSSARSSSSDSPARGGSATRCWPPRRKPTTSTSTPSRQSTCRSWSSGRVTLVGDAGYCASPLSGMGTSLALVGAYVLAGELGPADSFDAERVPDAAGPVRHRHAPVRRQVPGPAQQPRPLRPEVGLRHRGQRAGDEVDAALAVPRPSPPSSGSPPRIRLIADTTLTRSGLLHTPRQHPAELQKALHLGQAAVVDRLE